MNSRQRVIKALNHEEPDMVPIDMGSTENTTLTRIAYINLRKHLGMAEDLQPFVINRMMDAVYPADDMLRHYLVDFKPVRPSPAYRAGIREMPDDSFYDEMDIRWKKAGHYYDMVENPLRQLSLQESLRAKMPDPTAAGRSAGLRDQAMWLSENTDYAIVVGHIMWGPFELGCALRGYDQFLMDLSLDTRYAEAVLDRNLELAIGFWDAYLTEVGDYVQVCAQGDDLGMQTSSIISPDMYRRFIKPRHKKLFGFIRSKTKAKIFLHSCGSVYDLIPDLIEVGVEILSPVQFTAAKMDLASLKRDFGRDLTFWGGGTDTQHFLPRASVGEIRDQVKMIFDIMAPGGGFVFVPVHNIQADITPERVDAIYQTALETRKYG
ncbi:MAG: uroporphyrinogen decarboxylase family protein [Spirochaetia bacterium]|jgi:uroporphyrinogen decarboxylase